MNKITLFTLVLINTYIYSDGTKIAQAAGSSLTKMDPIVAVVVVLTGLIALIMYGLFKFFMMKTQNDLHTTEHDAIKAEIAALQVNFETFKSKITSVENLLNKLIDDVASIKLLSNNHPCMSEASRSSDQKHKADVDHAILDFKDKISLLANDMASLGKDNDEIEKAINALIMAISGSKNATRN